MILKNAVKKEIQFTYTREQLFNNASLRSNYKAKNLMDGAGNYIGDAYALSDDERDAFAVCVDNVVADVYDTVLKMTSGVDNAFEADADNISFKIRDNQAYNENVLKNVDISIVNALVSGILKEWYDLCANVSFQSEYQVKYNVSLNLLRNRLFQLKKKVGG